MGLEDELRNHFDLSDWAHNVDQLLERIAQGELADLREALTVALAAIGDIVNSMVTLAGFIDSKADKGD